MYRRRTPRQTRLRTPLAAGLALAMVLVACGADDGADQVETEPVEEPDAAEEPEPTEEPEAADEPDETDADDADADAEAASDWEPEGTIEFSIGTNPGGTPDVVTRQAAECLSTEGIVDNSIVIQNRAGGAWTVHYDYMIENEGNGNVLGTLVQPLLTTPITQGVDRWHEIITPLSVLIQKDVVVVARDDLGWENLDDLQAAASEDPGSVRWGGGQVGGTAHITMATIAQALDTEITYVPYDGQSAANTAWLGGDVELIQLNPDEAMPFVESGDGVILALLSEERLENPDVADIATTVEQGYDDALFGQFMGMVGPPNMPDEQVAYWDDVFGQLGESDCWTEWIDESYSRADILLSDELPAFLDDEYDRHESILVDLGLAA